MEINFENLEKINDLLKDVKLIKNHLLENTSSQKRWLSTKELSKYIPYSIDTINKKVTDETFICGVHFYQKDRMRFFDKNRIDEWVMNEELSNKQKALKESILGGFKLDLQP